MNTMIQKIVILYISTQKCSDVVVNMTDFPDIPIRRTVLVSDFLFKVDGEENTEYDSDHDAQKNIHQSNEFQTSQGK